jgi:hypothetical protein
LQLSTSQLERLPATARLTPSPRATIDFIR